jgi:hypothetical protein
MSPTLGARKWALTHAPLGLLLLGSVLSCRSVVPDCGCVNNPEHPGCTTPEPEPEPTLTYALVEGRFDSSLGKKNSVEISDTPSYGAVRTSATSAVIRLPDSCLDETAAQVSGRSDSGNTILTTKCGVWLKELEQALTRAQFRVISWDALRGLERSQNLPSYQAAQQLGADVLFMFNSLEVSDVAPGSETANRIEYFTSNARGDKGDPFPLPQSERLVLKTAVKQKLGVHTTDVTALSSTLDCTAIVTKNGESVWFYRNTGIKPLVRHAGMAFLFVKHEERWHFAPSAELGPVNLVPTVELSAVDVEEDKRAQTTDPYQTYKLELVRTVANDFVERFRSGSKPQ